MARSIRSSSTAQVFGLVKQYRDEAVRGRRAEKRNPGSKVVVDARSQRYDIVRLLEGLGFKGLAFALIEEQNALIRITMGKNFESDDMLADGKADLLRARRRVQAVLDQETAKDVDNAADRIQQTPGEQEMLLRALETGVVFAVTEMDFDTKRELVQRGVLTGEGTLTEDGVQVLRRMATRITYRLSGAHRGTIRRALKSPVPPADEAATVIERNAITALRETQVLGEDGTLTRFGTFVARALDLI